MCFRRFLLLLGRFYECSVWSRHDIGDKQCPTLIRINQSRIAMIKMSKLTYKTIVEVMKNIRQDFRILQLLDEDNEGDEFDGFLPNFDRDHVFNLADDDSVDNSIFFSERSGPNRVLSDGNVLQFFQLYFTDELFEKIIDWTDKNAIKKCRDNRDKNKGEWSRPLLSEII